MDKVWKYTRTNPSPVMRLRGFMIKCRCTGANVEPHLSLLATCRSWLTWEILGNRYCISYWLSFARHKGPIHPHAIACIGTDPDFQHASHRFAPSSSANEYLLARSTSLDRGKRIISGVRPRCSTKWYPDYIMLPWLSPKTFINIYLCCSISICHIGRWIIRFLV